jgi:hypothetical protein
MKKCLPAPVLIGAGVVFCLLGVLCSAVRAEKVAPVDAARAGLAKLGGFDVVYAAKSPSTDRTVTFRVRMRRPNKMRVDIESGGTVGMISIMDGRQLFQLDPGKKRLMIVTGEQFLSEMKRQQQALAAISWFKVVDDGSVPTWYPGLAVGLNRQTFETMVGMNSNPDEYSWLASLGDAKAPTVTGERAVFDETAGVRLTVNLADGLLERAEFRDGNELVRQLVRTNLIKIPPDEAVFDAKAVFGEAALKTADSSFNNMLPFMVFTQSFRKLTAAAKEKWPALSPAQKAEVSPAAKRLFAMVFRSVLEQTKNVLAENLRRNGVVANAKEALNNAPAKAKFAAAHPEWKGEALAEAWKKHIIEEATRPLVQDVLRTADEKIAKPFRQQQLDAAMDVNEPTRQELVAALVDPLVAVFGEAYEETAAAVLSEIAN